MLLSIDPGKTHFAYSIFNNNGKLLKLGMITSTISSFAKDTFRSNQKNFIKELKDSCSEYTITNIVAERYQVRGGKFASMMGANAEFISFMLGVVSAVFRKKAKTTLISPALWKSYMYRTYDFPKKTDMPTVFGFNGLSKNFTTVPIKEHQFDSTGIGVWWFGSNKGIDIYKKSRATLIKLWRSGKPKSKAALRSYNKVSISVK